MAAGPLILGNGSAPATPASGKTAVTANSSKHLATTDDAGLSLDYVTGPATAQSSPADPTGTTNTTGLMCGLAGSITPAFSGRIFIAISGTISNTTATAGDGAKVQIRYGTSTAPTNGAALTGTTAGSVLTSVLERATASDKQTFTCTAVVTGLSIATAYWLDLSQAAIVGGTTAVKDISISAFEI